MPYRVVTLPQAETDAADYVDDIARNSNAAALRWLEGLEGAIASLSEMPARCSVIPEAGRFEQVYRHLHYHSHRVVFLVDEASETVVVARIYHGARDRLQSKDLQSQIL